MRDYRNEGGQAVRYEKADLRTIGQLIYQLVMRKGIVDFEWLILPLEATPEWAAKCRWFTYLFPRSKRISS